MAGSKSSSKTHIMREQPEIPTERILGCLRDEYGLTAVALDFLPLGLDFAAGVYRASTDRDTCFLVKIKSGLFYESGCQSLELSERARDHLGHRAPSQQEQCLVDQAR